MKITTPPTTTLNNSTKDNWVRFTWAGGCFISYKYEYSSITEMGSPKVVPWITSKCQGKLIVMLYTYINRHAWPPNHFKTNYCVCVCVCLLPIHSGHQVRWTYQPGSHRRKVTQDFSSTFFLRCVPCFFSREGFSHSFPLSTVKSIFFVY